MAMFKNNRNNILVWYVISIAIIAALYFLLSDTMLTSKSLRESLMERAPFLDGVLSVDSNWGLYVLAALILYWFIVLIYKKE
jgi:hypothetical protein